jgi:DNA polymerase-4
LRDKPIAALRGAGVVTQARLARDGFTKIGQLQDASAKSLVARYGTTGQWLWSLANAEDVRAVNPDGDRKTISSETTFERDITSKRELERVLWQHSERVSSHAKKIGLGGRTIVLKLKTSNFKLRTRSVSLEGPTQLADTIFRVAREALHREADGTAFRLLGVGLGNLADSADCDLAELIDGGRGKRAAAERAVDRLRSKFGDETVVEKGRSIVRAAVGRQPLKPT